MLLDLDHDPPSPFESPPLDQRIAMGLHKLGLALKHQAWAQASEHGVSPTQGQILAMLAAEKALSASEVSTRLGIGLPTVSEAVTTLADKGFVRRSPDPRHPRARLLRLTAAGSRLAAHTRAWPEFLTQAVGSLTLAEQSTLLTALVKMIHTLQEQGQIPISRMCATCTHFRPYVHDGDTPHHCAFVDAPMGAPHLRLDCAEHEPAPFEQQRVAWIRFAHAG
jgi:DNA-binding MarR family transcriptional regulator